MKTDQAIIITQLVSKALKKSQSQARYIFNTMGGLFYLSSGKDGERLKPKRVRKSDFLPARSLAQDYLWEVKNVLPSPAR